MVSAVFTADDATLSIATATSLLLSSTSSCVDSPFVKKLATRARTMSVERDRGAVSMQYILGKSAKRKRGQKKTQVGQMNDAKSDVAVVAAL